MKELKIAVASDLHLGHAKNRAIDIVRNLRNAFSDNAETGELDIIFLAGDVFDNLLSLPDEDVLEIDLWIADLLRICKKHDILLRVLEGTPSHEWGQSERFETINRITKVHCDLKYIKDLSIEYIEKYDVNILYVPDESDDTTEKTYYRVLKLLKGKGLDYVDIAIMHGQFSYQLPPHAKAQKHVESDYEKIVREHIFIGHIHTHSQYGKIIAQGSFDRLAHGEEEAKGYVRATIRPGNSEITFVENTNAKKYITIKCYDLTLEETINKIINEVAQLPDHSYVRVEGHNTNLIFSNMEILIRKFPFITWSKLVREEENETITLIEDDNIFIPITITSDNIVTLLMERLSNSGVSGIILDTSRKMLEEII